MSKIPLALLKYLVSTVVMAVQYWRHNSFVIPFSPKSKGFIWYAAQSRKGSVIASPTVLILCNGYTSHKKFHTYHEMRTGKRKTCLCFGPNTDWLASGTAVLKITQIHKSLMK